VARTQSGLGRGVERDRGEQMSEQTCDRCDMPMPEEDERECDSCCQVLCWRCMYDAMLCNDCETSLEERATFPEEFEQ